MEQFVAGDVVVVLFPFSNLKSQKKRPALVLARGEFNNLILCQITSKQYSSKLAIRLNSSDFETGKLPIVSYIRPDKIFTSDPSIIESKVGKLKASAREKVLAHVCRLFR